jgi:hypothetical protein
LQEKGKLLLCSWEREKKVQEKNKKEEELVGVKKKKKKKKELVGVKKKKKKKKELVGVKKICCWVGVQI